MRKCRIGTAKFFTLLLLLYRTSVKDQALHILEHVNSSSFLRLAKTGAIINASTNQRYYHYYCYMAAEELIKNITLYRKYLFDDDSWIAPSIFENEKKAVRAEMLRRMKRAETRLNCLITSSLMNSPINSLNAIPSIDNVTFDDILSLRKTFHSAKDTKLIIAGNISGSIDEITKMLSQVMYNAGGDYGKTIALQWRQWDETGSIVGDDDIAAEDQVYYADLITLPTASQNDFLAYQIMRKFLNSDDKESFFNLYRSKGLAYSVLLQATNATVPGECLYRISGAAKKNNVDNIIKLCQQKLDELTKGREQIELNLGDYKKALKTAFQLEIQTSRDYGNVALNTLFRDGTPNLDLSLIDTITTDDIVRCARNILDSPQRKLFMVKY